MSDHPIVHIELSSLNHERMGKFYADLFGWHIEQIPEMRYATFDTHAGVGGGFNPVSDNNPAGSTVVYVGTKDIEATLSRVEALGGKTLTSKTEIPGMGWFALFTDPNGNRVGLFAEMSS
jgi:predicted enzyme related to lactoylglutathione lyase